MDWFSVRSGAFRHVLLVGNYAIKLPRIRRLAGGMRSNRWEREMWSIWQRRLRWENLCPVLAADPLGLCVIMPRAAPLSSSAEFEGVADYYPAPTVEGKPDDYGLVSGKVVIVDYGLPFDDAIAEMRSYFASFRGVAAQDMAR